MIFYGLLIKFGCRNPRHRIIPLVSLSGSIKAAFNDVSVEDPDFGSQALAEAGVVSNKLAHNSTNNGFKGEGDARFSPDRFIYRQDQINWRTQLEYQILPGLIEQIFTTKLGFMDMKELTPDGSPGLYVDMLAGDNSIIRKVFGKSKRFQPDKPSTKAQAAVALTSGRMTEAIQNELLRLEAESSTRQAEMEVIWSELLERGDIKRLWDEKMNEDSRLWSEGERRSHAVTFGAELTICGVIEARLGDLAGVWTDTHDSGDVEAISSRYSSDPLNFQ